MKLYAIRDLKAESHGNPFSAPNDALAERIFISARDENDSLFGKFPDDFVCVFIGDYDPETATISNNVPFGRPLSVRPVLREVNNG